MARAFRTPTAADQRTVNYILPAQKPGTRVSMAKSRLGPDHRGVWLGTVVECYGNRLQIVWDDEPEFFEEWSRGDCRYWVDRGLMRFTPPPRARRVRLPADELVCKVCGAKGKARRRCPPEHKGPGAVKPEHWGKEDQTPALTPPTQSDKMTSSNRRGAPPPTEESENIQMATTEKLSAKQAAIEIGTDARTLRKFLRSDSSTFEPCGQGNRYEFTAKQLKKLQREFDAWGSKAKSPSKSKGKKQDGDTLGDLLAEEEMDEIEEIDEADLEEVEDEPSDDELEEIEDELEDLEDLE